MSICLALVCASRSTTAQQSLSPYPWPPPPEFHSNPYVPNVAYRDIALARINNTEEALNHQAWLAWGVDLAKLLVPFYYEVKLRGNVEGVFPLSGLLGNNLEDQRRAFYDLPFPEFKTRFAEVTDKLSADNPTVALAFSKAIAGQSTDEIMNANAGSIFRILEPVLLIYLVIKFRLTLGGAAASMHRKIATVNAISLAVVALATMVIGFFLAEGFNSYVGVLGSIERMDISLGEIEIPYRWVVIASLLALFYAIWLMLRNSRNESVQDK
jgi:hypothetical protein